MDVYMEPKLDWADKVDGAQHEILSAMSFLNREPEPIEDSPQGSFLSTRDKGAAHAMEHLKAAFDLLRQYETERKEIR